MKIAVSMMAGGETPRNKKTIRVANGKKDNYKTLKITS